MPSTHQSGKGGGDYDRIVREADRDDDDDDFADAVKMLTTKNDATLKALVRGIRRVERARAYIEAEVAVADAEDRDVRKPLIGMLNAKTSELSDDEDDSAAND